MNELHHTTKNIGYLCTDSNVEQGRGDRVAIRWISTAQEHHEFTYRDLARLSNRAANVLKSCGIRPGDRIMILLPKIPELFAFFLGSFKLGANCCILFSSIGEDTLAERILDTGTTAIVSNTSFNFRLKKILPRLGENFQLLLIDDDSQSENITGIRRAYSTAADTFTTLPTPATQQSHFHFTSGSTGRPKGVQHVHGAVEAHLASFNQVMQPNEEDIYW